MAVSTKIPSARPVRSYEGAEPAPAAPAPATPDHARRPRPHLRALLEGAPVSDWASLFGDLSRASLRAVEGGDPVEWRVHDRTHLEFAIDYAVGAEPTKHVWEAYFFVPESFRIHEASYSKKAIYDDLQSYVRYAVPDVTFDELASTAEGSLFDRMKRALQAAARQPAETAEGATAMRVLRLVACFVRSAALASMRSIEAELARDPYDPITLRTLAGSFIVTCSGLTDAMRGIFRDAEEYGLYEQVDCAMRWTDEAISLSLEAICAGLAIRLSQHKAVSATFPELAEHLAARAVAEARHRAEQGCDSVCSGDASERDAEHIEFRRHVLKRFTASVLWLSLEVREGASWVVQLLYAIAAGLAMAFAVTASLSASPSSDSFFRYAILVVVAYAIKDRMKAFLQNVFTSWASKRFPDRLWTIRDRERARDIGEVRERAGFLPFRALSDEILRVRRITREHPLEEHARPEQVIWHQKAVTVAQRTKLGEGAEFPMLTEIFRLNIAHWLSHTDDPYRKIVFADPVDTQIYSATARRVYNINVVYRLTAGGADEPWHRIRVVVSRKGILRIDSIA